MTSLTFQLQANPPAFDRVEDLASLQYLNESSVMHSLRQRYGSNLVHTHAGPNMVVINPISAPSMYSEKVSRLSAHANHPSHRPGLLFNLSSCFHCPHFFKFLSGDADVQGLQAGGHGPSHLQYGSGRLQEPPDHSPGPVNCPAGQKWKRQDHQLPAHHPVPADRRWQCQQNLFR